MSLETVERGIELGTELVSRTISNGTNIIMFGEMGIGNTSSASAILSALANRTAVECVWLKGTGINNDQLAPEKWLWLTKVHCSLQRKAWSLKNTKGVLAQVGGYEIVQMVGAFLGAYQKTEPCIG